MARVKTVFRCGECGGESPRWLGRCPACEAWNTLVEELHQPVAASAVVVAGGRSGAGPMPIDQVPADEWVAVSSGIDELDRVLGGGLVPGSVTLLGGEPGIGKSTLLLQAAGERAAAGDRVLYVSAEESRQQVRLRAGRLGALDPNLWLVSETSLPVVLGDLAQVDPALVVIDSVQALADPQLSSAPGSVGQVRHVAARFVAEAKRTGVAVVLVGHVTKDGTLAGPRVLEHVVDTVCTFEGERHHALRMLRAVKHRFGPTHELGLFQMTDGGLLGVPDPSGLFLSDRRRGVPGSVVVPTLDGHRPLLVEIQALVTGSDLGNPRRSAQGVDGGRLNMVLAVLEERAGVVMGRSDVYALAAGGLRVIEPGADLALALAVVSAATDTPVADDLVVCAELGLGGELRQVARLDRRLAEAARLGFGRALVAPDGPEPPPGIRTIPAATLADAVRLTHGGGLSRPLIAAV